MSSPASILSSCLQIRRREKHDSPAVSYLADLARAGEQYFTRARVVQIPKYGPIKTEGSTIPRSVPSSFDVHRKGIIIKVLDDNYLSISVIHKMSSFSCPSLATYCTGRSAFLV